MGDPGRPRPASIQGCAGRLAVALLLLAACGREADVDEPAAEAPETAGGDASEIPLREVTLLFPSAAGAGLVPVKAEIFPTASPTDQAKQVAGLLLEGPGRDELAAPFPAGTALRSVFIDQRGTAYVSLSREARDHAPGGSAWEIHAVNSLAGSLIRSVPQIRRVQLLIEGQEIESLSGHLDLRGPVTLDADLVRPG